MCIWANRYHIGDNGGLLSFDDMFSVLEKEGFDTIACLSAECPLRRLPFCWVFGRAHWAVSLFGANVFVDQVMGECCYMPFLFWLLSAPAASRRIINKKVDKTILWLFGTCT